MQLVICEKPSVARDLAKVLGAKANRRTYFEGNGLRITWCFGHMCELVEPAHYNPSWKKWSLDTLPMIPEQFSLKIRKDVNDHWKALKILLQDENISSVVNACDAGREGELIFRYVYQLAEASKPIQRLWVSSMTPAAIQAAWKQLSPGENFNRLADAARCRSEADWLVGLNATRAMTCLVRNAGGDQLLSIGRVQTPTLALIVNRDAEIANFVPQPFWRVEAKFETTLDEQPVHWIGRWFTGPDKEEKKQKDKPQEVSQAERFTIKSDAEAVVEAAKNQPGIIKSAKRKRKTDRPPLLYDLNSLQQRANKRYSLSAQQTLDIAQALYERHKLITYPRTDARYLTPDQASTIPDVLKGIKEVGPYSACIDALQQKPLRKGKRIYNAAEVGDHHAIIPTGRSPLRCNLTPDEKRIFDLVARRLLAALSPDALFDLTTLIVEVTANPTVDLPPEIKSPLRFRSKGKIRIEAGWQNIDPPAKHKDTELPNVQQGGSATAIETTLHEGKTRPPPQYNEASLLGSMERAGRDLEDEELKRAMRSAGLGTPATRSNIIETLIKRGYIKRDKKHLLSTNRGQNLIASVPVEELKNAELTGRWEARLSSMSEGSDERSDFMEDVKENLRILIQAITTAPPPAPERILSDKPALGDCPVCGSVVRDRGKVYTCDSGRSCEFVIFKTMAGRNISTRMAKQLITKGHTQVVKGFKSRRTKKSFEAALKLNEQGKVEFDFSQANQNNTIQKPATKATPKKPPKATPAILTPVGMSCPKCKSGKLIQGRAAWGCGLWRDGCRFTFPFVHNGEKITPAEAVTRIKGL